MTTPTRDEIEDACRWILARSKYIAPECNLVATFALTQLREFTRVKEISDEAEGLWRPCTGCYESEDGHPVGNYPHSEIFGCELGSGCHECGGLGVVWNDYSGMAEFYEHQSAVEAIDKLKRPPSPAQQQQSELYGYVVAGWRDGHEFIHLPEDAEKRPNAVPLYERIEASDSVRIHPTPPPKDQAPVDTQEPPCGVCIGKPLPNGKVCICKGHGTQSAELIGLREYIFDLERKLEASSPAKWHAQPTRMRRGRNR